MKKKIFVVEFFLPGIEGYRFVEVWSFNADEPLILAQAYRIRGGYNYNVISVKIKDPTP